MTIVLMKPARKFIERQSKPQQERLLQAICRLPGEGDIKPLTGTETAHRLRVGGYRVIYTVDSDTVTVLTVGNRGDVYK